MDCTECVWGAGCHAQEGLTKCTETIAGTAADHLKSIEGHMHMQNYLKCL